MKTALVLGGGGFIGHAMVTRLKKEGYWVRAVDLKRPEFSETKADEFIQGDLREAEFVRRVIQFKGEQGNFYESVPYRYILPFHQIYQFAADMGGAGFIFTGENDADSIQNSATINLNFLEEQRKLNETFGDIKEWTECNRAKLDWQTKIFYSSSACMYPEYNQLVLTTLIAVKNPLTLLHLIPNTDGRNFLVRGYISLIIVIIISLLGLLVTTTSSDQKEHGMEEEKSLQLPSVEKLPMQMMEEPLKYGEMEIKLDHSSTSTSALKQLEGLWNQNFSDQSTLDQRRW